MIVDYRDQVVLITGGTQGIGLETALAFASQGARCVLTYRWGSADEDEVRERFAAIGATEPMIVQADVGSDEDTDTLMAALREETPSVSALISNAASGLVVPTLDDWSERGLFKTMHYSTWPMVGLARAVRKTFGAWPRYIVGLSSDGPDRFSVGYDFMATAKAAMETLGRYMSWQLRDEDVRVNVIRSRSVRTPLLEETFGKDALDWAEDVAGSEALVPAQDVGKAVFALCSGLMDAVKGQVITVDRGSGFADNLMSLFARRELLAEPPSPESEQQ